MATPTRSNNNRRPRTSYRTGTRKMINTVGRTLRRVKRNRSNRTGSTSVNNTECEADGQDEGEDVGKREIGKNGGSSHHPVIGNSDSDDDENFHGRQEENDMSCPDCHQNVMFGAEKIFRIMFLLSGVFVLGASRGQEILHIAIKVLEYSCVAWVTCLVLIWICIWQQNENETLGDWPERIRLLSDDKLQMMDLRQTPTHSGILQNSYQSRSPTNIDVVYESYKNEVKEEPNSEKTKMSNSEELSDHHGNLANNLWPSNRSLKVDTPVLKKKQLSNGMIGQHPEINKLFIIKADSNPPKRIVPNTIVSYENEFCVGKVMMMIRTPDADMTSENLSNKLEMSNQALAVSDYFRDKQRRFEFQFQVKLKKIPKGGVYMGVEFDEPMKMGVIQKALALAALGFVKKTNRGFHYSLAGSDVPNDAKEKDKGEYELPHLAFPILGCMDRLAATKPGDIIPTLGGDIYESPESIRSRKRGFQGDFPGWNLEYTYTMVVWSAYIDWIAWKCVNLPGIRPFSVGALSGKQAINLSFYSCDDEDEDGKHLVRHKTYFSSLEFSNKGKCSGKYVKQWMLTKLKEKANLENDNFTLPDDQHVGRVVDSGVVDVLDDEDIDDIDDFDEGEDDDAVEDLNGGIYLKCGDPIVLQEVTQTTETCDSQSDDVFFITNSFEFAVTQSRSPFKLTFEKAGPSHQTKGKRNRSTSKLIRCGDTVLVKMLSDKNEFKYLTLHKGWWLKWVSQVPRKHGFFVVITNENDGDETINETNRSIEMQSTYLSLGGSFCLKPHRRPNFEVGIGIDRSAKFGGRLLGIHPVGQYKEQQMSEYISLDHDGEIRGDRRSKPKFRTLRLCALHANSIQSENPSNLEMNDNELQLELNNIQMDAPVWVEMLHRTKRCRQRAYIVRVKYDNSIVFSKTNSGKDLTGTNFNDDEPMKSQVTNFGMDEKKRNIFSTNEQKDDGDQVSKVIKTSIRLRTGQDLAPFLQMGRSWKISNVIATPSIRQIDELDVKRVLKKNDYVEEDRNKQNVADNLNSQEFEEQLINETYDMDSVVDVDVNEDSKSFSSGNGNDLGGTDSGRDSTSLHEGFSFDDMYAQDYLLASSADERNDSAIPESDCELIENNDLVEEIQTNQGQQENDTVRSSSNSFRKKKGWIKTPANGIGRVAKSVKYGTTKTSKTMVKQTVNAGRFISKGISHKKKKSHPSRKEPRVRTPKSSKQKHKRKWRDHDIAVNKVMKNYSPSNSAGTVLAAEMTAPDQSLRMVSHILSEMTASSSPLSSQRKFDALFSSKIRSSSELDSWFLKGDAAELGVTTSKHEGDQKVHEIIVARCLWETHWREELCGLYEDYISFYSPLTKKPVFTLTLSEILDIRLLDLPDDYNPLPGFPIVVIESLWRCHYLALSSTKTRDAFINVMKARAIRFNKEITKVTSKDRNMEAWKLHHWVSFHTIAESSLSDGRGKWANISSSNKSKRRIILNSRRMAFDVKSFQSEIVLTNENESFKPATFSNMARFSEHLLNKALSISLNTMEKDLEGFASFLDSASRLRAMPINILDLHSAEAFCIFVNTYHCLLQHALLIHGAPTKRSVGHFMRCNCYEIGGNVFSLAELECVVIRGELSRGVNTKPPYVEAPKASKGYHLYSLTRVDARINFILNNGSASNLFNVPIFSPENLDVQLDETSKLFLQNNVVVDTKKRIIALPKVCEIYRNDFGDGNSLHCLLFCVRFLEKNTQNMIMDFVNDNENTYMIKFQSCSEYFHSCLSKIPEDS